MHTALTAALGDDDVKLLEANRLTSILTASHFASHEEKAAQRHLHREALEAAQCNPDLAASYLGTISAAAPTLQSKIRSALFANATILDGQPKFNDFKNYNVRAHLIEPVPIPAASDCSASNAFMGNLGKTRYQF